MTVIVAIEVAIAQNKKQNAAAIYFIGYTLKEHKAI